MSKFYVDLQGRYLGAFDGAEPPEGAVEIPSPPANAADLWNWGSWIVAVDPVRAAMNAYLGEVRDLREKILNRLAGIGMAALVADDQDTVGACVTARQRLLDITKIPGAVAATDLPSLEAAVKQEYASIVASVPVELVNAFNQVGQ
jgi:hypothetical protein